MHLALVIPLSLSLVAPCFVANDRFICMEIEVNDETDVFLNYLTNH